MQPNAAVDFSELPFGQSFITVVDDVGSYLRSTTVGKLPEEDVIDVADCFCFPNGRLFIEAQVRSVSAYRHKA